MKNIKSLISFFLFVIIAFGSLDEFENLEQSPKVTPNSNPSVIITASKLYKEYNANEIAADEKYKGKIIEVTGVIRDIGNDIMDNAYITLVGDEYFGDIQCYFNEKSKIVIVIIFIYNNRFWKFRRI